MTYIDDTFLGWPGDLELIVRLVAMRQSCDSCRLLFDEIASEAARHMNETGCVVSWAGIRSEHRTFGGHDVHVIDMSCSPPPHFDSHGIGISMQHIVYPLDSPDTPAT